MAGAASNGVNGVLGHVEPDATGADDDDDDDANEEANELEGGPS